MKLTGLWLVLLPALFLPGCQTVTYGDYFTESYMYSRWLPLIVDNKTTRSQIIETLGPPSRSFEHGRICTYRITINEWNNGLSDGQFEGDCSRKYYNQRVDKVIADRRFEDLNKDGSLLVVNTANWNKYEKEIIASIVEFHLILVFDDADVLNKHALLRIQP